MHANEKLLETFYTAFKNSDPKAMNACYHPDIEFGDPVFPHLVGKRAMAMWAMLGQRKADPNDRTFRDVWANDREGGAHWEAKYKFPATGRPVHNRIDAKFEFRDGLIYRHRDTFDFWVWSRMAFGVPGVLLGWGPLKIPVRRQLDKLLSTFIKEHPEYA